MCQPARDSGGVLWCFGESCCGVKSGRDREREEESEEGREGGKVCSPCIPLPPPSPPP